MGLFLQHKTKDIHWAIWKMEESLESLLTLLPATRRIFCEQEMQRFTSERRKMEWLSVRVLLYSMLQEDKEIIYSSEGKPSLGDHSFFISISHTKGYVAVILSPIAPVGIDIEQYGHRVKRVYLRKLCLSHFVPQEEGTFQVQEYATEQQQSFTVGYRISPDFVLTWTIIK